MIFAANQSADAIFLAAVAVLFVILVSGIGSSDD